MAVTDIDRLVIYRHSGDTELVPLDSPTTALGANLTTTATGISIGFTFTFDGTTYTTCALSARGFLRLAGAVTSGTNSNLFAANTDVVLAPWWDSLETAVTVGYVKYETQGSAPRRRFVTEWYCNLSDTYDGTDYKRAKFQVVLYETTNRFEYRYGTRETGGSPANTGSASVGFKGDTSVTASNYRDVATPSGTPVDDLTLGGSKTTSTTSLRHYATTEWPSWTLVAEPAWPVPDVYTEMTDELFVRVQEGHAEALWTLAANVNWLYCRFTPSLINFCPYMKASTTINDPIHVVPVSPSLDSLTYRIWIETYSGTGGNLVVSIDRDNLADPQPSVGGDWTNLTSSTEVGTAIGNHAWAPIDVAIPASADYLRFKFTDNDMKVLSILAAPVPLDDIDPLDIFGALVTYPSGFEPMSIAQIRQDGAALHPEFLNRAYRNVARIARDRRQQVFAFGHSDNPSDYSFTATAALAVRRLAVAPCSLRGWPGQTVDVSVYAYDSTNGGTLRFLERGGGSSSTFTVDRNGDEYRLQSSTLDLISDEPVIEVNGDPSTGLHVMFAGAWWRTDLVDEDLITQTTPPPLLEYLYAVAARIRRLALRGYAMAGLAARLVRTSTDKWRAAWMVPPATKALRPKVARHNGTGKVLRDTSIYGDSSGATANDEVILVSPFSSGSDNYPPDHGQVVVVASSERYDAAPTAPGDRLLESPTATSLTGATREAIDITYGVGVTLVPVQPPTAEGI